MFTPPAARWLTLRSPGSRTPSCSPGVSASSRRLRANVSGMPVTKSAVRVIGSLPSVSVVERDERAGGEREGQQAHVVVAGRELPPRRQREVVHAVAVGQGRDDIE